MKKILKILKYIIILFPIFIILFIIIYIFGGNIEIPKDREINKNICVHFDENEGSGEHLNFYTYKCKTHQKIDDYYTMECPKITFKSNKIILNQKKICKFFAHQYKDGPYKEHIIDKNGKILNKDK